MNNLNEIKHFTPAQTLMLTKPTWTSGKDLMKYSILDLVYRGILKVYKDWRLPHPNDARERLYTFVSKGEHFNSYKHSLHQNLFVNPFIEDDYEYQVRSLVRKVYDELGKLSYFKLKMVYKELKIGGFFISSQGLQYLSLFFLSKKGIKLKRELKNTLEEAENLLPGYADNNPKEAKKILNKLGSNVLLLNCFNDELIGQLKPLFNNLNNKKQTLPENPFGDYEDVSDILFYSFLDTIDTFDSSFDSFDNSFDFGSSDFGSDFGGGDFGGDFGGFD